MTEIPEHLLKRSQERRAAAAGASAADGAPAATSSSTSPAVVAAAAAPAKAAAPAPAVVKPKVIPPYITAANTRRKLPIWVTPVVVFLPLWVWVYMLTVQKPTVKLTGPLKEGAAVYNNCASCHGASGGGGSGYPLSDGNVVKTFPKIEDQINFVYLGSNSAAGYLGKPYGDPARGRIGGAKGPMPKWGEKVGGELSDMDIVAVVCHERYTLGGVDAATAAKAEYVKEREEWCTAEGDKWLEVEEKGLVNGSHVDLSVK